MGARSVRKSQAPKDAEHSFTAPVQQRLLNDAIEHWKETREHTVPVSEIPPSETITPPTAQQLTNAYQRVLEAVRQNKTTFIKSTLAAIVATAFGWLPVQRMLLTSSAEAFINARTITVRAPISGEVILSSHLKLGSLVASGQPLLRVDNARADASHFETLKRAFAQTETNLASLKSKQTVLLRFKDQLKEQAERYRIGRTEEIATRITALDAQIAGATAQYTQATTSLSRSKELLAKATTSQASFDQAQRDTQIAQESLKSLQERRKGLLIERAAAQQGTFLTEGYSDASQSSQRSIDIELELAELAGRIRGLEAELRILQSDLQKEEQRVQSLSTAAIRAGADGRVWEVTASPGEFVNAGDILMRLLDCASASVTAVVTESAYQKLRIGQQATFRPKDGGPDLKGWVADLSGLARTSRNDAIQPAALTRANYHVTLSFPDLGSQQDCGLSRSGLVVFD
jgi:multidrug resistance efflux pump